VLNRFDLSFNLTRITVLFFVCGPSTQKHRLRVFSPQWGRQLNHHSTNQRLFHMTHESFVNTSNKSWISSFAGRCEYLNTFHITALSLLDLCLLHVCRSLSLSYSHDINIAGVEAIKMHNPLQIVDTSIESRRYYSSQWMSPISYRNCAFL
jgi:hypothetical protein